jgi:hypothetical protein
MKRIAVIVVVLAAVIGWSIYAVVRNRQVDEVSSISAIAASNNTSKPPIGSREYVVLLDVSASRPEPMILQGRQFVHVLVDQMTYGDRLVVLEMYEEGVNDEKNVLDMPISKSEDVTSLEEKERLEGARKGVKDAIDLFFQGSLQKPILHTDIITTLSIVSEKLSPESHNCLVLLSDMLQSSKEFEFEHLRRMPSSLWINEAKKQGLIRPLYGSSVVVVGADPSTHEGVMVREFWQQYFAASNASLNLQNYRTTPPSEASACE